MIILREKTGEVWEFQQNSLFPGTNWYGNDEYYVLADGSELAAEFLRCYPYVDIVIEGEDIVGVVEMERPEPEPDVWEAIASAIRKGADSIDS